MQVQITVPPGMTGGQTLQFQVKGSQLRPQGAAPASGGTQAATPPPPPGRNSDALQYPGAAHAPAPAETPQVDRAAVQQLCDMGFPEEAAIAALLANNGSSDAALQQLIAAPTRAPGDTPEVDRGAVQQLCDMGFPEEAATAALLANNGSSEAALNALLST